MSNPTGLNHLFVALWPIVGVAVAIFWMVLGWRAMRAHERLAQATEELVRRGPLGPSGGIEHR